MHRREAIQRVTLLLGGILSAQLTAGLLGEVIHTGASVAVSADQEALLADLAEIIIPTTDTPGAKAAGVAQFIVRIMRDCYKIDEQEQFYAGLERLGSKGFAGSDPVRQVELVRAAATEDTAFFKLMKQLTVAGYFTSEIGATQALAYLPIPGKFEGNVPLKPNQKAWAL
ncbi:MAG: hypothetical protein JWL59_3292 [Chthoniobacteraceae bacterium]|nr:hypothetical protein [Chthoniobacteraceae bacterium]